MENINYVENLNKEFMEFMETAISNEIDCYVIDSNFTKEFNKRLIEVMEEIRKGNPDIEFSIIFNVDKEISLIDSLIIGNFAADLYSVYMSKYYKTKDLQTILNYMHSENDAEKRRFIINSINVFYNIFNEMFKTIKCNKSIFCKYEKYYNLRELKEKKTPLMVLVILILEDMCKFFKIRNSLLIECYKEI
ncbi:hypothetical protein [Clostridium guangxiense]|uniref:hypothetical protein n=2 Tax=Clostridium TaxID=1485 RepID=UPI001E5B3AA1|nr:hypothetical protein [Clostridium guangxiense]MCD2346315.1 hypothetical protein [Clostridium guangxiense]